MPNTRTNAPRGALVFDMRLLGRQAGSDLTQTRIVPAPDDVRLELVGVPAGADVELEVRFEAVSEGVLATGSATAPLRGECARCLAPLATTITASFQELYLYADGRPHGSRDGHRTHDSRDKREKYGRHDEDVESDDEQRYLDGDLLDLEPAFRDAVVLALPMSPLCRDDCPGLCAECGAPLAEAGPDHGHEEATDPRWAGLRQLDGQQQLDGQPGQPGQPGQQQLDGQPGQQPDRRARAIDL
jgi:uncharacterized protein